MYSLALIIFVVSEKAFEHFSIGFKEKYMYCGGGHLGFPIGIKNIEFVEDLPMIIPMQFGFKEEVF